MTGDAAVVTIARDWVVVAGPDAASFLQGQLSQDVAGLAPGGPGTYSLLLAPTGKVDAWLGVHRLDEQTFLLDVDPGAGEAVVARLGRFKLRTKADIARVEGWRCTAPLADLLDRTVTPAGDDAVGDDAAGDDAAGDAAAGDPARVEVARVEQGIPRLGADLTEESIPAEAGQWLVDRSGSFTKGCYTGQELVARIDSRGGRVPRPLRGLRVDGDGEPPAVGTPVVVAGDVVGAVTSAVRSERFGLLALAPVHRSVEPGASAVLGPVGGVAGGADDGRSVVVVPLPFA